MFIDVWIGRNLITTQQSMCKIAQSSAHFERYAEVCKIINYRSSHSNHSNTWVWCLFPGSGCFCQPNWPRFYFEENQGQSARSETIKIGWSEKRVETFAFTLTRLFFSSVTVPRQCSLFSQNLWVFLLMHPFAIFSLQEVNFSIYCMKEILKQSINKNFGQMTEFLREVKKIEGDIVTFIFCIDNTEILGKQRTLSRNSDTGEFSSLPSRGKRPFMPRLQITTLVWPPTA